MAVDPQYWDPIGRYIVELREDSAVAAIVGANPSAATVGERRVAGKARPGWEQGAPNMRAFIAITTLALPPHPQVPIQRTRHAVRCMGRTDVEAEALYAAAVAVLHRAGPRQTGSGKGIYVSHDDTGASEYTDPDTQQPGYVFVVESVATTQAVVP